MRIREIVLPGCLLLLLLALPQARLAAQEPVPPETVPAVVAEPALADTILPPFTLSRSPRGAFIRSVVLPGWGQAWVGAPGRGGVYFAMEVGSLWMVYKSGQRLREARVQEAWLVETGQLQPNQRSGLVVAREGQREDWLTLALFLLLFSGADAFVAAHLADFDERVGVIPTAGGGMRLQFNLPVGRRP